MNVVLTGTCETVYNSTIIGYAPASCKTDISFNGKEACGTELPIQKALTTLGPFYGAILIVVGALMCFLGRKFIFQVFGAIVGFVFFAILFALSYALFLPIDVSTGLLAGVIVVCAALGGVITFFTYKFTKAYTVQILAGVAGAVIFIMLGKLARLDKELYNFILAVLGAGLGVFLGNKFKNIVKSVATALIGSYLLTWGIGQYAPGYPGNLNLKVMAKNPNANLEAIAYLAGFIVLAIAGFFVQMHNSRHEEEEENEDDAFKGQDESRTCGCF